LEDITLLKDEEITTLCKIVRWPGGTDNDEGHTVSQKADKNLKLCTYLIKHQKKPISWPCNYDAIALENVWAMILICDFEETYENPKPPLKWDVQDPAKLWEQFDDYLHYTNGELNLHLVYVMQKQVKPMLANEWIIRLWERRWLYVRPIKWMTN
jgi:hypothetical protein